MKAKAKKSKKPVLKIELLSTASVYEALRKEVNPKFGGRGGCC